jgi:hypothetical protein
MKKLLKKISYLQLILDLLIVFIGVTLAYVFTNYQEDKKQIQRTEQVLLLLDVGLERYQKLFKGFVSYHENYNEKFSNRLKENNIPNLEGITYPSPAYPINAITLLTDQGYEVLEPSIYLKLTLFSNAIQRLSYIEQKLVSISEESMKLVASNFKTPNDYHLEQKKWTKQYLLYLRIRKSIAKELLGKVYDLRVVLKETYPSNNKSKIKIDRF